MLGMPRFTCEVRVSRNVTVRQPGGALVACFLPPCRLSLALSSAAGFWRRRCGAFALVENVGRDSEVPAASPVERCRVCVAFAFFALGGFFQGRAASCLARIPGKGSVQVQSARAFAMHSPSPSRARARLGVYAPPGCAIGRLGVPSVPRLGFCRLDQSAPGCNCPAGGTSDSRAAARGRQFRPTIPGRETGRPDDIWPGTEPAAQGDPFLPAGRTRGTGWFEGARHAATPAPEKARSRACLYRIKPVRVEQSNLPGPPPYGALRGRPPVDTSPRSPAAS